MRCGEIKKVKNNNKMRSHNNFLHITKVKIKLKLNFYTKKIIEMTKIKDLTIIS